jgi:hypothetical protein
MKRDLEGCLKRLEDQLNVQSEEEEVSVISFGERNCDCKTTQECMRRGHCIFIDIPEERLDEEMRKEVEIFKSQGKHYKGRIFKMLR